MSMVGYYNEFTVVKRKIVFKLLVKENSDNHYFSHDQFMPMSLNVLSIFKVTLIILRHYFSIEKVIDMGYTPSRRKQGRKVFSKSKKRRSTTNISHVNSNESNNKLQ